MKQFTRTKEDFYCEHCGYFVSGTGYTNHCPMCLYSKHVDVFPGDRAATCEGLMEPVGIIKRDGEFSIVHVCTKCGFTRKNKTSPEDSMERIIQLSTKPLKE